MLMQGVANLTHLTTITLFPYATCDNALKRRKGLLESLAQKHNHLKDKATRHMRILNVVPQGGVNFMFIL
jgi:hypothetical protein